MAKNKVKGKQEKRGYEGTTKKSTGYEGTEKNATGYEGTKKKVTFSMKS